MASASATTTASGNLNSSGPPPATNAAAELDYLKLILKAKVYDVAVESPLQHARNLSNRQGNAIYLKREDTQPVFSFKLRGAYNRMVQLTPEERKGGVITCSAGNHAQGVSLAAKRMGIHAIIVMPVHTPQIKVNNVRNLGGEVLLFGNDFDAAKVECNRLAAETGRVIIHPYDDPYVIAGQGTIGLEILRQHTSDQPIDAIFCCVGGGGLLAGVAAFVKRVSPEIKVIGVETYDADAMTRSLAAGHRVELPEVGLFADGAAVRLVGAETFRICKELVDDMVLVSNDEICAAIKDIFEDTRSIVEPAGALAVAGAKKYIAQHGKRGSSFVAVCSGANMNFDRLRFVAERAELGEKREALMSVIIPEKPGSFLKLYQTVHPRSITEFSYRYANPQTAHIFMSIVVVNREAETRSIIESLAKEGMQAHDLSDNEMAKAHARHLIGGRSSVENEKLYSFSFPERPGALKNFLDQLQSGWNVTLFHYRNVGGDVGKVLVGIQVPPSDEEAFHMFLSKLGYPHNDESENIVYKQFLR